MQVFLLSWFPKSQTSLCLTNDVDNPIAKLDLFGSEQSWYFLVFFGHIRLMMILSIIHKSQRKRYTTKSVVDQNNFPENMASNRLAVWSEKKCIFHFSYYFIISYNQTDKITIILCYKNELIILFCSTKFQKFRNYCAWIFL